MDTLRSQDSHANRHGLQCVARYRQAREEASAETLVDDSPSPVIAKNQARLITTALAFP